MLCLLGVQSHPFAQPTINPLACCICWAGLLGGAVFPPWNEGPNSGSYSSAVGDAVLGAEPAPFPSPLPPVSSGAGPVRSLRALLWICSVPLFCEQLAVCSGQLIFSLSFAVPQFKLVSHKSSLRLSSGHSGPVLTLSNDALASLFHPHLLVADAGVWGTFLLGVAFRHVICGFYLLFSSQSGCPP